MLQRLFSQHPASVGESYWEHLRSAWSFAATLVAAGFCCLVHGLLPFLFVRAGSERVTKLHKRMVTHRHRGSSAPERDGLKPSQLAS